MNYQRAMEILKSPDIIDVLYRDKNIWIKDVDRDTNMAKVSSGPHANDEQKVAIDKLKEI